MARFELKINVQAASREELADTLILIQKQIADGYCEGHDRNESGSYYYDVSENTNSED